MMREKHTSNPVRGMFRTQLVAAFESHGSLYGGPDWDQAEAHAIRQECEERDVPMGYGRVARKPHQLPAWTRRHRSGH